MTVTARPDRVVQLDGRAKAYRPIPVAARRAAILDGLRLYADGEPYDAHEAWEPAWMGTDDLAERALLQGLIKLAAADVHAGRANPPGVVRNLDGALERLTAALAADCTTAPGIRLDLSALIDAARRRRTAAARGEATPTIPIPWRPA